MHCSHYTTRVLPHGWLVCNAVRRLFAERLPLRCAQGIVYGKPVHQGITALKPTRNLKNLAEERVGRKIGGLRVLNSYWVNQVPRTSL